MPGSAGRVQSKRLVFARVLRWKIGYVKRHILFVRGRTQFISSSSETLSSSRVLEFRISSSRVPHFEF